MNQLNQTKLGYLNQLFETEMKEKRIKGAAIQIIQNGEVAFSNQYGSDKEDTIYKIFSMSKPIASVAAMILYERGMLDLYDPVSKYLPAFSEMKVVGENGLEDAKNPILIRDLMNMTSGLVYPDVTGMSEMCMQKVAEEALKRAKSGEKLSNVDICSMFADAPLKFEPGKRWNYGTSTDVCGAVVEVISGVTYGAFIQKEILEPLGMTDTAFYIPESKLNRMAKVYTRIDETGHLAEAKLSDLEYLGMDTPTQIPYFESAGGGLYSTLSDYAKFAQMLLHDGIFQGKRILGRKTIAFMHLNQLSKEQEDSICWDSLYGYSYGNFMRVMVDKAVGASNGSIGEFGWDGLTGNYFCVDQEEDLAVIYMQQIKEGADQSLRRKMRQIIYGSLE